MFAISWKFDTILVKYLKNASDEKMDVIFVFSDPENSTLEFI